MPVSYRVHTRVSTHRFRIVLPSHWRIAGVQTESGQVQDIGVSSICRLRLADASLVVLVPRDRLPHLHEAVLLMGKLTRSSKRLDKYLTLYRAYECVVRDRDPSFTAIRHALAHPQVALTKRKTVESLRQLFGTTEIDLDSRRHARIFYMQFAELLIATDAAIGGKLDRHLKSLRVLRDGERAIIQDRAA